MVTEKCKACGEPRGMTGVMDGPLCAKCIGDFPAVEMKWGTMVYVRPWDDSATYLFTNDDTAAKSLGRLVRLSARSGERAWARLDEVYPLSEAGVQALDNRGSRRAEEVSLA